MAKSAENLQTTEIQEWIASFLLDREAGNKRPRTIKFYAEKLNKFASYCKATNVGDVEEITPDTLRRFLLWLVAEGHNPGGVLCHYRSVKAFVFWYIDELEPETFRNPFRKVKAPKVDDTPLPPVPLEDVKAMLKHCGKDWYGIRDRAMILALLDTGARAAEFLALNVEDVNMRTGSVYIADGKGGKPRSVFIGRDTRRSLRRYLRTRNDGPLWVKKGGGRLKYSALRSMLRNKAKVAKIDTPSPHDFRRAFCINMLRAGVDLETLRRLMGHSDLQTLRRYLALIDDDLRRAHAIASPADQLRNLKERR